jgi:hypothetical protein
MFARPLTFALSPKMGGEGEGVIEEIEALEKEPR